VIAQNLQYPIDRIDLLPITTRVLSDTAQHLSMEGVRPESFIMASLNLPDRNWTIGSLSPSTPATWNALRVLLIAGLTTLLILGGVSVSHMSSGAHNLPNFQSSRRNQALPNATESHSNMKKKH
jgi:two-component system C4-dicarboxylate transport sensor histidine kinase DctB